MVALNLFVICLFTELFHCGYTLQSLFTVVRVCVGVCVFLHLLHTENQNLQNVQGVRHVFKVEVRTGLG